MALSLLLPLANASARGSAGNFFIAQTDDDYSTINTADYVKSYMDQGILKTSDIMLLTYDFTNFPQTGVTVQAIVNSNGSLSFYLPSSGVISNLLSDSGGSSSITFTWSGIGAGDVVVASIKSSDNAVTIQKVTPGTDQVTVEFSGDPGNVDISAVRA